MSDEHPEWLNIADRFLTRQAASGNGERIALRLPDGVVTYAELELRAARVAGALRELGVRREERVFMALPDGIDYVATLFAILKIGAVAVMLNPTLKAEQLCALIDYCSPAFAVVFADALERWEAAIAASGSPALQIAVLGGEAGPWPRLDEVTEQVEPVVENAKTHRDDPAIWLFSGGTTGLPKAVVQTHRSYANTTALYTHAVGYRPADVTLSVPKLYFGYATGCNLLFPFSVGASAVLFPQHPTAEILFEQIGRHHPSILVNVPSMVQQMVNHPEAASQDLSCLRFATSAGEALPVPLYHRWKEVFGVELLDGLGTAEMWHIFLSNRPDDVRPGTLGRPVEGFDVRVRDESGKDLGDGETGQLWVRGDSQALGYWRNLDASKQVFRGKWVVTGDLIARDANGYFHYHGRDDDVLKVKGKWLSPQEVESCLMRHPGVAECAVVGVEDGEGLTKPIAFVVPRGATDDLEAELKQHVLRQLEAYKHPRQVILLQRFPRTHLGKIDRGKLKAMAEAETA